MRVLVLATVFPNPSQPTHGLFVLERLRALARHADVRVVAPVPWLPWRPRVSQRKTREGLLVDHPTFFYVPRVMKCLDGLFLFLSVLPGVVRIRRQFPFDLIDAHFAFPEGFAAILLGRWFRRPVTITLRGTIIPLSVYRCRRWAMQWAVRRADRIIAVAEPLARKAIEMGAAAERVEVIENGVDTARFLPMPMAEARKKLGLSQGGRVLVSVGHLSRRKGFHRVTQVLPALLRERPDLVFAVVGGPGAEGDYSEELRKMIRALGLVDHVRLVGAQPPESVALWLNAADVFVLASDYEGCPNVVWEALSCGRPVVATRVGEVERMVPTEAGVLLDRADDAESLERCLGEALRRDWDRERIRAHAERHTWEGVATRVLKQWGLAVGTRKASHPSP